MGSDVIIAAGAAVVPIKSPTPSLVFKLILVKQSGLDYHFFFFFWWIYCLHFTLLAIYLGAVAGDRSTAISVKSLANWFLVVHFCVTISIVIIIRDSSDNKFPEIPRTIVRILTETKLAIIVAVSNLSWNCRSSYLADYAFVTVSSEGVITGTFASLMLQSFFWSRVRSWYKFFFFNMMRIIISFSRLFEFCYLGDILR